MAFFHSLNWVTDYAYKINLSSFSTSHHHEERFINNEIDLQMHNCIFTMFIMFLVKSKIWSWNYL